MPQIFFAIESAVSRSLPLSAQRIVNLFVERQDPMAKSQSPIFGAPGITSFNGAEAPAQGCRGGWVFQGDAYFVFGNFLYRVDEDGTVTDVSGSEQIPGTGPVDMSDNGIQMGMVNGTAGWMYDQGTGLTQISGINFHPANTITFQDGYFIFDWAGTNQWFLSGLYDGMSYSGNDTASAEAQPGEMIAVMSYLQFLYLFTTTHIEIWYNAGTASFPFQRYSGGVIPFGCIAPNSVVAQDGAVFFLGTDKIIYRLQGNNISRVSTHAIEHILAQEADLSTVQALTYTVEGHKFVYFTLVDTERTIAFDISTGKWHERISWEGNTCLNAWRGRVTLECYQKTLIGDRFDGRVGYVDWTTYTEYDNTMRGLVHSAPLYADRNRIFLKRFELDIQAGVGNAEAPDPQMMLQVSRDGGNTWETPEMWRSMGAEGEYLQRLRWLRLGQARQWVFGIEVTDPVPRVIIAAHATTTNGLN